MDAWRLSLPARRAGAACLGAVLWVAACGDPEGTPPDADSDVSESTDGIDGTDVATPDEASPDEGDDEDGSVADDGGDVGEDGDGDAGPAVTWEPCDLFEESGDLRAECAALEMPLRWGVEDGRTFRVVAKRYPSRVVPIAHLWLLEGGPGGSGTHGYPAIMEWLHDALPSVEPYTIDARGTGDSEFLPCPADDGGRELDFGAPLEEVQHCIDHLAATYGDDLEAFGTTPSARDLHAFVEASRVPGRSVLLWGNSAGTHWALRFLQLFPDAVDGVVLEALLTPEFFGAFQDEGFETALRRVLTLCAEDGSCSARLPDPVGALRSAFEALDAGHCPALGLDADGLRAVLGVLLYYRPYVDAIPALVHRVARCDEADLAAIDHLWNGAGFMPTADTGFSIGVFLNEYLSEMWDHPDHPDDASVLAYLDTFNATALLTSGQAYWSLAVHGRWPLYEDPLDGAWPETDVPILMLQGELDPATYPSQAASAATHLNGANQIYLSFPWSPHGVVFGSPTTTGSDCGVGLLRSFLRNPAATLDTSCTTRLRPLDFEGLYGAAEVMGTANYWDN